MAQQHLQNMTQRLSHLERMNDTINNNLNQLYLEKIKPIEDNLAERINDTVKNNLNRLNNENVKLIEDHLDDRIKPIKDSINETISEIVLTNLNILYKEKMNAYDDRITGKINQYIQYNNSKNHTSETTNFSKIEMIGNNGTHLDIKIDPDNALTITNSKSKDIDIFIPQINLLSDLDSTSINNGSVVVYGGMSIMKHLYIGDGIFFKNSGSEPASLDYYNEGTLRIQVMGIWADILDIGIKYQCIGSSVTIMINETTDIATTSGTIQNTVDTYLPPNLSPVYDIGFGIYTIDNEVETFGKIIITATGQITIQHSKDDINFSGNGISGFRAVCITYLVK